VKILVVWHPILLQVSAAAQRASPHPHHPLIFVALVGGAKSQATDPPGIGRAITVKRMQLLARRQSYPRTVVAVDYLQIPAVRLMVHPLHLRRVLIYARAAPPVPLRIPATDNGYGHAPQVAALPPVAQRTQEKDPVPVALPMEQQFRMHPTEIFVPRADRAP
jgi:hypothetical protein